MVVRYAGDLNSSICASLGRRAVKNRPLHIISNRFRLRPATLIFGASYSGLTLEIQVQCKIYAGTPRCIA